MLVGSFTFRNIFHRDPEAVSPLMRELLEGSVADDTPPATPRLAPIGTPRGADAAAIASLSRLPPAFCLRRFDSLPCARGRRRSSPLNPEAAPFFPSSVEAAEFSSDDQSTEATSSSDSSDNDSMAGNAGGSSVGAADEDEDEDENENDTYYSMKEEKGENQKEEMGDEEEEEEEWTITEREPIERKVFRTANEYYTSWADKERAGFRGWVWVDKNGICRDMGDAGTFM
ncbi:hypothetical protein MMC06_003411 [Schaereria dolodes]|nr:hypothetical protein [Schaereria dolodes]